MHQFELIEALLFRQSLQFGVAIGQDLVHLQDVDVRRGVIVIVAVVVVVRKLRLRFHAEHDHGRRFFAAKQRVLAGGRRAPVAGTSPAPNTFLSIIFLFNYPFILCAVDSESMISRAVVF